MNIITRAQWGARPFARPRQSVPLSSRKFFVVHYPGAGTPPSDVVAYAKWIERIHMDQNGWAGVGYNYFISHGRIAEGCGRDIVGSHSPPHNYDGIGVNIWTSNGQPRDEDLDLCRDLYEQLNRQKGGVPLVRWYHGRDYATECPGPTLRTWVLNGMPRPSGKTEATPAPEPEPLDPLEEIMGFYKNKAEFEAALRDAVRHNTVRAEMNSYTDLDRDARVEENLAAATRRGHAIGRQTRAKVNRIEGKLDGLIKALKAANIDIDLDAIAAAAREGAAQGAADVTAEDVAARLEVGVK